MTTQNLLVELFVEELPPKALKKLGDAFAGVLFDQLKAQGLTAADSQLTAFASPRRLAAHITAVSAQAADKAVSQKLMPVSVGLDASGNATPALLKKLQALGADASAVAGLKRAPDGKAEALFYDSTVKGATLAAGLQKALEDAIAKLPIPKVMQYQLADGWSSVNFVRPAHGLVALHGADVVPVSVLGLAAGRQTRGHRFEAQMDPVVLLDADHYARQLEEQGGVIPGFAARHGELLRQLNLAAAKEGLAPIEDEALLDEVTALVERPNVLLCQFEPEFLAVPQECLILTMKANQKYFPLLDAAGGVISAATAQDTQRRVRTRIPIGSEGVLLEQRCRVVGYLMKSCVVEGSRYFWDEYLLATEHGYLWLTEENGHCSVYRDAHRGNVAENAGGVHCLKYGLTVHNVLRVKGFTIEGEAVEFGSEALDAPGLDLLPLIVGSEGMLAVTTEVTVKLIPKPQLARCIMASFDDVRKAGDAVAAVIAAGIIPAGLEMMDKPMTAAVEDFVHAGYDLTAEAILLCESDGTPEEVEEEIGRMSEVLRAAGATAISVSRDEAERLRFLFEFLLGHS